jgi:hypothetical protein
LQVELVVLLSRMINVVPLPRGALSRAWPVSRVKSIPPWNKFGSAVVLCALTVVPPMIETTHGPLICVPSGLRQQ